MSNEIKTRVLFTNLNNIQVALPLNDDFMVYSGFNLDRELGAKVVREKDVPQNDLSKLFPIDARNAIKQVYQESRNEFSTVTFKDKTENVCFVALSISEIFSRVAEAQKKGDLLVDLTKKSGADAVRKKALSLRP